MKTFAKVTMIALIACTTSPALAQPAPGDLAGQSLSFAQSEAAGNLRRTDARTDPRPDPARTLSGAGAGRGANTAAGFACPHEFGCGDVELFFHRIGGHCVNDPEQGIFCQGPDGPDVPIPE